ncbi:MAG TPA: hypothetical protein PLQ32_06460 [Flavihumibacter sp.]|nr:hypothetical protein [Flavihumibacter sp.]
MKRIFTILLVLLLGGSAAFSQGGQRAGERVEALKIAYLTKKLNLTTEEAQKFWPVYNQYMADLKKARQDARSEEADELEKDEKVLAVRKKYQADFSKALSPARANEFYRYEKEFANFVAKELQERRQNRLQQRQNRR